VPEASQPRTVEQILPSAERTSLERALRLVRAAALAVDALHARQIVHGSLSPSTILIAADDSVTLLLADQSPAPVDGMDSTRDYWSPQQLAGEPARPADDLYALGLIAGELLADHLSPKIETVLQAQRSWSPSERFASGAELVHELDRAAAPPPIRAQEPAWAAARRVAQARAAHRLALETPPDHRPRRRIQPAPIPSHPILRRSNYPDLPLPGRWVAILVAVLCSVYLFPLYFMLFSRG
jgi:serine/threonine protein kinase